MHLAFLISAHTDPEQLKRLIYSLPEESDFFIHIDKKSDLTQFTNTICGSNIHYLDNRIDVMWGTIIEVDYQMVLINEAINYPTQFDYLIFLSGMDYPIWSNSRLISFLEETKGKNIIVGMPFKKELIGNDQETLYSVIRPYIKLPLIGNRLNSRISKLLRIIIKALGFRKDLTFHVDGEEWTVYKGSAWWCITPELANYVHSTYYFRHKEIRKYFRNQFCPAETLIQTIAFNSEEFADTCIIHNDRYTGLASLTPLHYINYGKTMKVLNIIDYDDIIRSGKPFARKFRTGESDKLMDLIDNMRN